MQILSFSILVLASLLRSFAVDRCFVFSLRSTLWILVIVMLWCRTIFCGKYLIGRSSRLCVLLLFGR